MDDKNQLLSTQISELENSKTKKETDLEQAKEEERNRLLPEIEKYQGWMEETQKDIDTGEDESEIDK